MLPKPVEPDIPLRVGGSLGESLHFDFFKMANQREKKNTIINRQTEVK